MRVPISQVENNNQSLSHLPPSQDEGQSLPPPAQERMEQAFGHDFSGVRIHSSPTSERATAALGAHAFTIGKNIYFGTGELAPGTSRGDRLLAHELTHVVQQDEGRQLAKGGISDPADIEEQEAYANEQRIAHRLQTLNQSPTAPEGLAGEPEQTLMRPGTGTTHAPVRRAEGETPMRQDEAEKTVEVPSSEDELIPAVPEPPPPALPEHPEPEFPAQPQELPAPARQPEQRAAVPREAARPDRGQAVTAAERLPAERVMPDPGSALEAVGMAKDAAQQPPLAMPFTMPAVKQSGDGGTLVRQAETLEARLDSVGTDLRTAITDRASALAESASAAGEQAIGEVHAAFAAEQEALAAAEAETISEVNQGREVQLAALEAQADAQRLRLDETILAERTNLIELIADVRAATLATGEAEAARAIAGSEERATAILTTAEGIQGEGDATRAEAQRDGARRIARDTAQQCREAGTEMAAKVGEEAAKLAEAYQPRLEEFLQRLDEATTGIGDEVMAVLADASAQIDAQADQAILAVQKIAAEGSSALSAREEEATAEIDALVQQRVMQLREAGTAGAGQLIGPIEQARQALLQAGQDYAAEVDVSETGRDALSADRQALLQQGYDQAAGALEAARRDVLAGLDELYADFEGVLIPRVEQRRSEAVDAGSGLRDTITRAVGDATGSMHRASEDARVTITGGIGEALAGVLNGATQFRSQIESAHGEAMAALTHAVDEGLAALDTKIVEAEAEMSGAVQTIGSRYDSLKSEAERRSAEERSILPRIRGSWWSRVTGFFSDLIASVQQWFVDVFGEFWGGLIFGILAAVVMVIVGIVLFKIIAALIASAVLAAKIIGIILAVVAVIGVLYLAVTSRWEEYRQDHNGAEPGISDQDRPGSARCGGPDRYSVPCRRDRRAAHNRRQARRLRPGRAHRHGTCVHHRVSRYAGQISCPAQGAYTTTAAY